MELFDVNKVLPPKKEGWEHSKQVGLCYPASSNKIANYGIGYYSYNPPFKEAGFTDFANFGRIPTHWFELPENPNT